MDRIKLSFNGEIFEVIKGITIKEIIEQKQLSINKDKQLIVALLNGRAVDISEKIVDENSTIEFIDYTNKHTLHLYGNTLSFILHASVFKLFTNVHLKVTHSLARGFYYHFELEDELDSNILSLIKKEMESMIKNDLTIEKKLMSKKEAITFFLEKGMRNKALLLENSDDDLKEVLVASCNGFSDIVYSSLANRCSFASKFDLKLYGNGFILQYPNQSEFALKEDLGLQTKLFGIYKESINWSKIVGVGGLGKLNKQIANQGLPDLIKISESLHEKKIAKIADEIASQKKDIKFVLIAGPSSSGKTTFSKRLGIQLKVNGINPLTISVDNYFLDRALCPLDEDGEYDFEHIEALDLKSFNNDMFRLLQGKSVMLPKYDFNAGKSIKNDRLVRLLDEEIVIVEGIHCLNEKLSTKIPQINKYKIYISALTQISFDSLNRIHTTDTRILRRMIRDYNYRGYSPSETLLRFPSVIRGEKKWIFPFQEEADVMFNSALLYEFSMLKKESLPLLESVKPDDKAYPEAQRLLRLLSYIRGVGKSEEIPPTSILREFLGGSSFNY